MSLRPCALFVALLLTACGPTDEEAPVECPADRIDPVPDGSIARRWDEQALDAIRRDTPNPGVHARNLFHLSGAIWDAWVGYQPDGGAGRGYLVDERQRAENVAAARDEAISHAAFTLLSHRYRKSTGGAVSEACFRALLDRLGYEEDSRSAPATFGRRVAEAWIEAGLDDGANERGGYADTTGFISVNPPLDIDAPGTVMVDPGVWQPLQLEVAITQNGQNAGSGVQQYIGAQWGNVRPFAMAKEGALYHDPGPFPAFGPELDDAVVEVIRLSSQMEDDELVDISPGALGNNTLGSNDGTGHPVNPATGVPYEPEPVRRGDFGRVVAEFWADGPRSETPPGHWNVLANEVADHPGFERRIGGSGPALDRLEWDVKTYFALNGALHDAAITAWQIKRASLGVRPISLVRYMGGLGQSSDPNGPSYDPEGLPLVPGLIEVVTDETAAGRHAGLPVGEVAIRSWRSYGGGVGWIRAVEWMPYQLRTFVTPAFPGFISGHSTFSRAAAEVLTAITGSEYFPGGLAEFVAERDAYLRFERGPSTDVRLQWATYYDAADQAGRSRLWGGIHIEPDDFVGRRLGSEVGRAAWAFAQPYFDTVE